MKIVRVEDFLGELKLVALRALLPDRQTYNLMLLQPDGPIEGSEQRIGHYDQARGEALCRAFLKQAVVDAADLAVTPEYCLPWALVEEIAQEQSALRPAQGAIWILGCESISPTNLLNAAARLKATGHFVHHEEIDDARAKHKSYVDPLLYVFWCERPDGNPVLGFVIQLKTEPCRDKLDVEQRCLYVGELVYTLNREINRIGLISIICSDAFKFDDDLVAACHKDMLIIHAQLNPKPAHADYARYRKRLLSVATRRDVELLCLNWAADVQERGSDGLVNGWENNAGSGFYVPPAKFAAQEATVVANHWNGLYYGVVDRWHGLFLDQGPHAVLLQKQKVMMLEEPEAVRPTTCVTVLNRWTWQSTGTALVPTVKADAGFSHALVPFKALPAQLTALCAQSPLFVERAMDMVCGVATKPREWYEIGHLSSMRCEEDETLRRITIDQDADPASRGKLFRRAVLQRAHDAASLPGNGAPWPRTLSDLEAGFCFQWSPGAPFHNVIAGSTHQTAGLVFLGDQADEGLVSKVHDIYVDGTRAKARERARAAGSNADDAEARSCDRLCVVYRQDHQLRVWGVDKLSQIDRAPGKSPFDIGAEST